jgi:hypothetical protein
VLVISTIRYADLLKVVESDDLQFYEEYLGALMILASVSIQTIRNNFHKIVWDKGNGLHKLDYYPQIREYIATRIFVFKQNPFDTQTTTEGIPKTIYGLDLIKILGITHAIDSWASFETEIPYNCRMLRLEYEIYKHLYPDDVLISV